MPPDTVGMIKVSLCCFTAVHHRFEEKCVMQLYTQGQVERTSLVTNKVLSLKAMCSLPFFFSFFLYSAQLPADAMPFPLLCTFYNVVRHPVTYLRTLSDSNHEASAQNTQMERRQGLRARRTRSTAKLALRNQRHASSHANATSNCTTR